HDYGRSGQRGCESPGRRVRLHRGGRMTPARPDAPRQDADMSADDHLIAVLAHNARTHSDAVAMRERDRGIWQEYRWCDYLDQVLGAAAGLDALGVAPGDTVLVIGDNRPAMYFGMLAAITLRAVPSPAYPDT